MREIPSWAVGVPTQLLRKVNIIPPSEHHLPVHTLTFAMPDINHENFNGPAVHHSQVRVDMGDVVKMVIPGYKPKSYSICELRETEFDVTFKVYPNGRASGFLDRLQVGDYIMSFGKRGARTRNAGGYVGIIVFGVGITEGYPVAKAELEKGTADKVKLLWASRTEQDTFWRDKLQQFEQDYPEKFELIYLYSREKQEGCLHGRISPALLKEVFKPPHPDQARFLSVGTKPMMKDVDAMLTEIGYPMPEHHLLPKHA
jgi:NAD(P)H-flavin reductase